MTPILDALTSERKDALAAFIAEQVRATLAAKPGSPIDSHLIKAAINQFEVTMGEAGAPNRVTVLSTDEALSLKSAQDACDAAAKEVVAQLKNDSPASVSTALQAQPAAAVRALIDQNATMRRDVHHSQFIQDMHAELVQMVRELLPVLETIESAKAQVEAAKNLVRRAEAGSAGVPVSITPQRLVKTIEQLVNVSDSVLCRFGSKMRENELASQISAVSDAVQLLAQIHGPVEHDEQHDADSERP